MLIALVGVSGIGKTFFKEKMVEKLGFIKVNTIKTRTLRKGEKNGISGIFLSNDEIDKLKSNGQIIYDFEIFGARYAYFKDEIMSDKNVVVEMHYTLIDGLKEIRPDLKSIYIFPRNLEMAKKIIYERKLITEKDRIEEMEEQYSIMCKDKNMQKKFDYIIYNDYDQASLNNVIDLVSNIIKKEKINE